MLTHIRSRHGLMSLVSVAAAAGCGGGGSVSSPPPASVSIAANTAATSDANTSTVALQPVPGTGQVAAPASTSTPSTGAGPTAAIASVLPGLPALPTYTPAGTLSYAVRVTRRDADLYEVSENLGLLETHRCPVLALGESATLTMAGFRGQLNFTRSGTECPVVRYFARAEVQAGTYQSTVGFRRSDWYALTDASLNDAYRARTAACRESSEALAAQVTLNPRQHGHFGRLGAAEAPMCEVQHLYVMTPLP
jgi:hypothetical protein